MGAMRNNIAGASVLVALMLSTSQSLPIDDNENSLKSNSLLVDSLTLDPRSSSPGTIHECLFIDPDLPICDVKWMLNAEKDATNEGSPFNGYASRRSRRSVDVSSSNVVVYTIEGCVPTRLPFSMPSCEGISLDRIVDIQKFRPFAMKGVTKPPFVFPEFNYPQWLRMMTRLRNHATSKTGEAEEERRIVPQEISLDDSIQARTERLRNAATMKETIPNAMAASRNIWNGSSPNRFIPDSFWRGAGSMESRSASSTDRLGLNGIGKQFENAHDPRSRIVEEDSDEWLNSDDEKWMDEVGYYDDRGNSMRKGHRFGYYLLPLRTGSFLNFRRRPERSLAASRRGIVVPDPASETRGIAGDQKYDGSAKNMANLSFKGKDATLFGKRKKKSKGLKFDERQTDADKNAPTSGIARRVTGSRAVNKDSPGKIDALAESKAALRKSTAKETPSRKKYRNHGELPSSRGH